jgi:alpha-ketoglutarate-dependent taurine dioxygenase
MTNSLKEDIGRQGYAFAHEFSPGTDAVAVANAIGRPLIPWEGGLVQELVPRDTATPNTYSGIYGLDRFPFHTDLAHWRLPPRYLLLRCVAGHADVPTLLLDSHALLEAVTKDVLTRAIYRPRRPRDGKLTLLRLYEPRNDGYCFRWDEVFLKPASKIGELAGLRVKEQLRKCVPMSHSLTRPGDLLLIDNWRMLHARSLIPAERMDRKIQRIYLEDLR